MRRQHGITLMELMVVMAIVAILTAIAYPSYRQYVIRTNRTSAKTALMQTAQALERCSIRSTPYSYNSAVCAAAVTFPVNTPDNTYRITGAVGASTYTLTATPQGTQATDTQCANFTLDQTGDQDVSGSLSATPERCWNR